MRCSHCGHENPGAFKFCGMCGNKLLVADAPVERPAAERELASTRVPWPPQEITPVSSRENRYDAERPSPSSGSLRAAEDFLRKRPASPPPREEEPDRFAEEEVDRPAAEIHGPSFLGLSDSSDSTAYLLDDDGGGSSAVRIVFLLILLAAAAAVWWKWEPIKTYVWTQASMHAQEAKPATANPQTDASSADNGKPADSSAQQSLPQTDKPAMTTETPGDAAPAAPAAQNAATAGKPSAAADKTADTPAASKEADDSSEAAADQGAKADNSASPGKDAGKDARDATSASAAKADKAASASEPKAEDDEADAEAPAPPVRKAAPPKPRPDDGSDLLAKAENYLYGRGGLPQSCRQALVYFKAAADKQNPAALSHVGAMYATGECGVHINRVQAYKWFSKAYELQPGNQYLERNLTMLWREMSEDERQAVTRPSTTRGQ